MESERRTQRYPSIRPLQLRCDTWSEFVDAYASDVCRGGMFIRSDDPPEVMSSIEVRLKLPEGTEVTLNARVVHVVSPAQASERARVAGIGIEFVHIDAEQKRQILQLVEFARSQGANEDPNASFARTLLESATPMAPSAVGAHLSTLPDSLLASSSSPEAARGTDRSHTALPAVRVQSQSLTREPANQNASSQVTRAVSQSLGAQPTARAATGPIHPARAQSAPLGTTPARGLSQPLDAGRRAQSQPLGAKPSRALSQPLDAASRAQSQPLGAKPSRALSQPLDAPPSRSASGPIGSTPTRAQSGPVTETSRSSSDHSAVTTTGAGINPTGQPLPTPARPTDLNRLKLVLNALAHKHYEDGARLARDMLVENPGDPQVLKWQAICFGRMAVARGDVTSAAEQYVRALQYDENNREAREYVRAYLRERKLSSLPFGRYFVKKK